jgi:DNA-binding MarR family transcriptional regulator
MPPVSNASAQDVAQALHRFGLERDRLRAALARRLGLAVADLDALEHLELAGPLPQRDLAERLVLTSGAVTQLVDRLERLALVTRTPHPTDRRVTLVQLGKAAQLPSLPELDAYHAALVAAAAALNTSARRQVTRFLSTIADSAAETAVSLRANGIAVPIRTGGKRAGRHG